MRIKPVLLSVALLSGMVLFAQHNEEVTIEGSYRPKVNKVDKILLQPESPQPTFEMPGTETNIMEIQHRFPIQLEKISPQALNTKGQPGMQPTKNFLMAGLGTRLSPVFLYKHNSMLTKTLGLGVGVQHYSTWLGIKDYAYSGMMNNAFEIGLSSSRFKDLQINGQAYYRNDVVHYYGLRPSEWTGDEDVFGLLTPRQAYNTVGTHVDLSSATTRLRELSHHATFDCHYLFSTFASKEHHVDLRYGLAYTNNWWGDKSHPQQLGADLSFQFDAYQSDPSAVFVEPSTMVHQKTALFAFKPYFEMKDEYYRLHLGVHLDALGAGADSAARVTVRPDLRGSLFVLDKKVEFYAGLNGGRKLLTYAEVVGENPFVGNGLLLVPANVKLGFEGGVRTNIMNTMDLHLGVRYRHTVNDPFYIGQGRGIEDQWVDNLFELCYDETKVVSVLANMRWLALDRFTVDAGLAYHNYTTTLLDHPLYRPTMEGRLKLNYEVNEVLSLHSAFLYQGGRYGRMDSPLLATPSIELKPMLDLSIGADYRIKDELTVFAKVDNLLHQRYLLYVNYPVTGIEFFAGVKMRF